MSGQSQTRRLSWAPFAAIPLLLLATAALQARIDVRTRSEAAQKEDLLLRSGPLARKLSLGYDALLADIYWTRAVQYYGSRIGTPHENFELLGPLLDISTTLDPQLIVAYRFGAIFLSEPKPIGAGRTDLAVNLVQRGIDANPDQWLLNYDLGFLYYWRLKDYPKAAEVYATGGRKPHAPLIMTRMAARVAEKGGSIETSRMIFLELYESSKDRNVRKAAMKELRALKAQEDEEHLDEIIQQYRKRFGHYPATTKEMVAAGLLPGVPVDTVGFPYIIGPDGKSHLNPDSPVEPEPEP